MSVLPIVTGPDNPVLRNPTKKVQRVTKDILKLLKDMEETVIASKGAGLAATQVGRTERICIARIQQKLTPLINPEIPWISTAMDIAEEGCLSLPETWLMVPRPREIVLKFLSPDGKRKELKLSDWDARVVQHEIDHLEGVLIVDYIKVVDGQPKELRKKNRGSAIGGLKPNFL